MDNATDEAAWLVFGFLALEELREETSDGSTGNYGVLDQRGLLKWIPDNARAFGHVCIRPLPGVVHLCQVCELIMGQ